MLSRTRIRRSSSSFHVLSSVCVERLPLIGSQMNIIEKTMKEYLLRYEKTKSLFSDHEMRHFEDLKRAKRLTSGKDVEEKDMEMATKQTAQDFEDSSNQELSAFSFSPLLTREDEAGNKKSVKRCPESRLLLIPKVKEEDKFRWLLPHKRLEPEETLRQAAERALGSLVGSDSKLRVKWMGNSPVAVYRYLYPQPVKSRMDRKKGADIFFFKAQYIDGNLDLDKMDKEQVNDFQWLNRTECEELFRKEGQLKYWKALRSSFFFEDLGPQFVDKILKRVQLKMINKSGVSREEAVVKQ